MADAIDELHSELWFYHTGLGYPTDSRCMFQPEKPEATKRESFTVKVLRHMRRR